MKRILLSNKFIVLSIAMLAFFAVPAGSVGAQTMPKKAPEAVIYTLYKQHNANNSPFFQKKSRARIAAYFTKATTDLIWKDATRKNQNEVGAIDGDPLYNAQDIESKDFIVVSDEINQGNALVKVNVGSLKDLRTIKFFLVIESGLWKIQDIDYGGGENLLKWLEEG